VFVWVGQEPIRDKRIGVSNNEILKRRLDFCPAWSFVQLIASLASGKAHSIRS
jgi:hypothetical protein